MLFWNNKKKKELDAREQELDKRERLLNIALLDLAVIARKYRLNNISGLYFDAIK